MRIQLIVSPNTEPVPFAYLPDLRAALHNWLGPNDIHNDMSLYSLGWLRGSAGKIGTKYLHFQQGATLNISFYDSGLGWELAKGIIKNKNLVYGMTVEKAIEIPPPNFGSISRFAVDGAVLIRDTRADSSRECVLWDDIRSEVLMTERLISKMKKAGLDPKHHAVRVKFDRSYPKPKVKVMVSKRKTEEKDIEQKGNVCPVIIEGTPEAIHFAWLVGVGDLTGSGFGALI